MNDYCFEIKKRLEQVFSMPFEVESSIFDGEIQYSCYPSNNENEFFTVKSYIHDQIRLVVEIDPQNNAWGVLNDMSYADSSKQKIFYQYIDVLSSLRARIVFSVNNEILSTEKPWPELWRFFKCRIDMLPIPEFGCEQDMIDFLAEWMMRGTTLILSLLTVEETASQLDTNVQQEGGAIEVRSKRYERSRFNREICLAHKGYSCYVCGFNFSEKYGQLGKNFIEVHHTTPVSEMGSDYKIDIDRDLVPVCSNCHSMIHRKNPPYTVDELRKICGFSDKQEN